MALHLERGSVIDLVTPVNVIMSSNVINHRCNTKFAAFNVINP